MIRASEHSGIRMSNLRLLDIALTHRSYVNEHPETRSNARLAYLGGHLDLYVRMSALLESGISSGMSIDNNTIRSERNAFVVTTFGRWFDHRGLANFLRRVHPSERLPDSVKADVVRALLSATYMEEGMARARELVQSIWDFSRQDSEDYVGQVQDRVQKALRTSAIAQFIEYAIIGQTRTSGNKAEYEVACRIGGQEYGRGRASNLHRARRDAAKEVLNNDDFVAKYVFGGAGTGQGDAT